MTLDLADRGEQRLSEAPCALEACELEALHPSHSPGHARQQGWLPPCTAMGSPTQGSSGLAPSVAPLAGLSSYRPHCLVSPRRAPVIVWTGLKPELLGVGE